MNDSHFVWSVGGWLLLSVLNGVSVVIAGIFGVNALLDPSGRAGITGPATPDLVTYASLYGIRSVLLTVAVLTLLVIDRRRGGDRLRPMLVLAGAIQVGDTALLLAVTGNVGMAVGPVIAAIMHLVSAVVLGRRRALRLTPAATSAA